MRAGSDRARRSVRIGKIMELTDIRELHREKDVYIGKEITVGGWVRNNRDSKNFGFLVINDGTFFEPLQVVYGDGLANFQEICKIICFPKQLIFTIYDHFPILIQHKTFMPFCLSYRQHQFI